MSSSNNFNVCPHCSNPNMINAKYCSRCGHELKLPQEPIVCHNCRTRNAPMANFCRNCGAELKVGYATKICTRCGSEVPAEQSVCTCGYAFAQPAYATPIPVRADGSISTGVMATNTDGTPAQTQTKGHKLTKEEKKQAKLAKKEAEKSKVYSHKGGRAFAIIALVLLLAFAYFIIVPSCVVRPSVVSNFDKGIVWYQPSEGATGEVDTAEHNPSYGYDMIMKCISAIMGGNFNELLSGEMVLFIIIVLVAIFTVAAVVHLIVCIVRAIKPKRSKKPNWCYFTLALITTVIVGLIVLFNIIPTEGVLAMVAGFFKLPEGMTVGYVLYAIPVYFWFFFLYSLIAKARVLKEQTVTPATEETAA